MTEQEIALLASKIAGDTNFWIALVGAGSALAGALLTLLSSLLLEWFKRKPQQKIDRCRQKLLNQMLQNEKFPWRDLSTLAAVIGCDQEQTKDLLIAIGARGSETDANKWGLIRRHPLP